MSTDLSPSPWDVLELVPDAMIVVDADGAIIKANELSEKLFGYVKIIACIEAPVVLEKILTHLERKEATAVARLPPCRALPQASLFAL